MPRLILSSFLIFSYFVIVVYGSSSPNLFLTTHGGTSGHHSIRVFDLFGNEVTHLKTHDDQAELRSMLYFNGKIVVLEAHNGLILETTPCQGNFSTLINGNEFLAHPYGIAEISSNKWIVTNQDSGMITLIDYKIPSRQNILTINDPRGITTCNLGKIVCIASKEMDSVLIYDTLNWNLKHKLFIKNPIGLYCSSNNILYITQESNDGYVTAYSINDEYNLLWRSSQSIEHGGGIQLYNNILYIVEQSLYRIITINATNGQFINELINNIPDAPESLLIANTNC